MLDIKSIKIKLEKLVEYYDGELKPTEEEINRLKSMNFPESYITFIKEFGWGLVLEDYLHLWEEPENSFSVYSNSLIHLENSTIFGENLSGEMLLFNNKSGEVLIVFANGEIEKKFSSFEKFIVYYLDYIIEIEEE
ncbi:hypothetical protein AHALO_0122 [Malaciobacter halophilus]|nr:SMI1/KNR4 family protein [Malaciobacter halophilus]AXH08538.1 hypothetical protein AHALO_0122 [Malaciobacter halophilus]